MVYVGRCWASREVDMVYGGTVFRALEDVEE